MEVDRIFNVEGSETSQTTKKAPLKKDFKGLVVAATSGFFLVPKSFEAKIFAGSKITWDEYEEMMRLSALEDGLAGADFIYPLTVCAGRHDANTHQAPKAVRKYLASQERQRKWEVSLRRNSLVSSSSPQALYGFWAGLVVPVCTGEPPR